VQEIAAVVASIAMFVVEAPRFAGEWTADRTRALKDTYE